jgi:hypothetical protein
MEQDAPPSGLRRCARNQLKVRKHAQSVRRTDGEWSSASSPLAVCEGSAAMTLRVHC